MSRQVTRPTRRAELWKVLLGAPVVATIYFFVVYLAAEATCSEGLDLFSTSVLRGFIYVISAASIAVVALSAWRARQLMRDGSGAETERIGADELESRRFMGSTGLMLCGMFGFFVLLVAAPVIGSMLC